MVIAASEAPGFCADQAAPSFLQAAVARAAVPSAGEEVLPMAVNASPILPSPLVICRLSAVVLLMKRIGLLVGSARRR